MKPLYEILVPTVRNDGRPIHTRFHRVWDARVRALTGGLTIMSPGKGHWISGSGALFQERMIPVRIMCERPIMLEIAKMTKEYYEQEAVLFYVISNQAEIYQ